MREIPHGTVLLEDPMNCMACGSPLIAENELHMCSKCERETKSKVKQRIKDHQSGENKRKTYHINILKHMKQRVSL